MQMQDVAVSIAGGMNPLMVFMQQAPQIVGSFGGIKNTVAALATVFTPLRMLIGGVTAAFGLMAVAALQGHQQQAALTKSLELTGGAAGVTAGQVTDMGTKIAAAQGVAVGTVRETMQSLVDSGTFVGSTLESAGRAATALSKLTGASADEVVKDFSQMKSGVAAWAAEHNKSYNFLTADQYTYIRNLESQGRSQEAMRVALDALATTMEERSVPALGTLEKAWTAVGAAVSKAWDFMKGVGREESAGDRLARLKKAAEEAEAYAAKGGRKGWWGETIDDGQDAAREARSEYEAEKARQDEAERRAKERAEKAQAEQKKIHQSQKQYQDLVTQGKLASDQKQLADELKKQQALADIAERSFQRGEISAAEHAVRLNAIDQKRLELQLQNLRDRRTSEDARVTENPEDVLARSAAVKQLDAQIVTMQTQLDKAVSDGKNIVSANALQTARDRAQQWAAAWKAASDQVRSYAEINAGTRSTRVAEPVQRADAEAVVRTAAPRRQLEGEQRDLRMAIDLVPATSPAAKAELQRQLAELTAQGKQYLADLARSAKLDSLTESVKELFSGLALLEDGLDKDVSNGELNFLDAERRKFAARAKALPQIQELINKQRELAVTGDEKSKVDGLQQQAKELAKRKTEFESALRDNGKKAFSDFFRDVTTGAKTAGQALRDMVGGFAQSMLDLISKRLGDKMLSSVLDAIDTKGAGGGGAGGSLISKAASWIGSFFHDGGVVGAGGARTASFPAAMWSVAPRYHTGGIAGLKPNEVPAVLMAGEEVLTANDPRHKNNGGTMATRSMGPVSISISVTGAEGGAPDQAAAAQDLGAMMEQAVNAWATKQSRPGGVLWKGK
jgi:phage-related minor tail protein